MAWIQFQLGSLHNLYDSLKRLNRPLEIIHLLLHFVMAQNALYKIIFSINGQNSLYQWVYNLRELLKSAVLSINRKYYSSQ